MPQRFDFWDEIAEQRLEEMLRSGHEIMRKAIDRYNPVAIFAGFSGGNDSIVSTHFACENYGAEGFTCLGIERAFYETLLGESEDACCFRYSIHQKPVFRPSNRITQYLEAPE